MRVRYGPRGEFFGCSAYPRCRGTRAIAYSANAGRIVWKTKLYTVGGEIVSIETPVVVTLGSPDVDDVESPPRAQKLIPSTEPGAGNPSRTALLPPAVGTASAVTPSARSVSRAPSGQPGDHRPGC